MKDQWEEPTESALGGREHRSFDLDIDFSTLPPPTSGDLSPQSALHQLWPERKGDNRQKDLIVFDPLGYSVAIDLRKLGYPAREVTSGVDVMTGIADHPTAAIVCGPAEDAEQRRLLTAAIRLRFPEIPIVYASTHGRNPAAVRGAMAEGAHIVIPLPLPGILEIEPALADYIRPVIAPAPPTIDPEEPPQETLALGRDELQRLLNANPVPAASSGGAFKTTTPAPVMVTVAPSVEVGLSDFEAATELVAALDIPLVIPTSSPPPASSVFMRRSDLPMSLETVRDQHPGIVDGGLKRGELGELLRAISPFLWGLDDAARYMDVRAAMGDVGAQGHQRTLKLLGNLLRQLQQRIDDSGL